MWTRLIYYSFSLLCQRDDCWCVGHHLCWVMSDQGQRTSLILIKLSVCGTVCTGYVILGVDILGVDILGVDILGRTHFYLCRWEIFIFRPVMYRPKMINRWKLWKEWVPIVVTNYGKELSVKKMCQKIVYFQNENGPHFYIRKGKCQFPIPIARQTHSRLKSETT